MSSFEELYLAANPDVANAVRDAENGEAFLGEIEWSYGFATRLLSGEEEAEMTVRGVCWRRFMFG